ncbi:MAG: hypothetical protein Tsb0026_00110 [Sulfuricaulis sp.]
MKRIIAILLACLSVNSASAAIYHGIFTGTVDNIMNGISNAPFSNGDPFTLRFEIDTTLPTPLFVGLDINGVTGTFGNTFVSIIEFSTEDRFSMVSALDSPYGIFNGISSSDLSLEFIGGTGVFSGNSLAQPFSYSDFDTLSGHLYAYVWYSSDLIFTSGAYLPGPLPSVPLPSAVWLFGSGLLGLIGFARTKKARPKNQ